MSSCSSCFSLKTLILSCLFLNCILARVQCLDKFVPGLMFSFYIPSRKTFFFNKFQKLSNIFSKKKKHPTFIQKMNDQCLNLIHNLYNKRTTMPRIHPILIHGILSEKCANFFSSNFINNFNSYVNKIE